MAPSPSEKVTRPFFAAVLVSIFLAVILSTAQPPTPVPASFGSNIFGLTLAALVLVVVVLALAVVVYNRRRH